jgi:hypothetical protein
VPKPSKHASHDKISSGADQSSRDMIEIPLQHGRNVYHYYKSFCTSCGIFLIILCPKPTMLEGKALRGQFNNLLTKILPGRTQVAMKWSLPNKDCKSRKDAFFFLGQASTNNDISTTLSGVTYKVNFLVSTVIPKNSTLVVGATLFSGDSSNPQFSNNLPNNAYAPFAFYLVSAPP